MSGKWIAEYGNRKWMGQSRQEVTLAAFEDISALELSRMFPQAEVKVYVEGQPALNVAWIAEFGDWKSTGETQQEVLDAFGTYIRSLEQRPDPDIKLNIYREGLKGIALSAHMPSAMQFRPT